LKSVIGNRWLQIFLLLTWIIIGTILRLTNLTEKTIWSDEFSTIVFSLGNSFKTVPFNQVITGETLLQPAVPQPSSTVANTINNLFTESTHPPLFFMLNHWWLQLFPTSSGLVSLWGARSLSVAFGVLSIPAIFALSWAIFNSAIAAQISAAFMAVSPFGIALAQEARHYTLATLWVIASIYAFILALRSITNSIKLPLYLVVSWIIANILGVATHYFVIISLGAEAIVFGGLFIRYQLIKKHSLNSIQKTNWFKIFLVGCFSFLGCLAWLPVWLNLHDRELIKWIYSEKDKLLSLIEPIGQLPLAWATMLFILPIESSDAVIIAISAILMLGLLVLTIYSLRKIWMVMQAKNLVLPELKWLGSSILANIAIFFILAYAKFSDLTSAIRYNFVYFPNLILFISGSFSFYWNFGKLDRITIFKKLKLSAKSLTILLWSMGLIGSILVVSGTSFQKPYRPDLMTDKILELSDRPALVAIYHFSHIQTSKLMGIAWEIKKRKSPQENQSYKFLLNNSQCDTTANPNCLPPEKILFDTVNQMPKPLDVWVIDYPSLDINVGNDCVVRPGKRFRFPGFRAKQYHCSHPQSP
jgi:uncharacterized membrane protein